MRHFVTPEAGNWLTFDRIKEAVFVPFQCQAFAFIFLSLDYYFSHKLPEVSRPGKNY